MIEIKIREGEIQMHGHAGCSANGQDIVCAAISAMTCNLINSLRDLANEEICTEVASGFTVIAWQKLSDRGKLLIDSWFLGLSDINREYNCIRFI